ncbi:12738_t:CDS:2 [Ambispora leptoticha]|uniref:12738_t:CDS:1 n=1 Tax=Ambispora leptoticha TaxID=144679 RepID=A0A9N8VHK7_9GLOM|nr:12738_t:CDS:2 [Ambispora leptoticha]
MSDKTYNVLYKPDTPSSVIDKHEADFKAQGAKVVRNKLYKGLMVTMPEANFTVFSAQKDPHIDTIEADGEVKTQ